MSEPILTTLAENPDLYEQTIALVNASFDYPEGSSIEDDFKPLFNKDNLQNLHIIKVEDKVVAHLGVSLRKLVYKDVELPIAMLGGIAVDEEERNQGHFAGLMDKVLEQYESQVGLFLLWSDLFDLYQKKGFYLAGGLEEVEFASNFIPAEFKSKKLSELSDDEWTIIKEKFLSFQKDYLSPLREEAHWNYFKEMKNVEAFLKDNYYLFMGKGADLSDIIHEVGLSDSKELESELNFQTLWLPEGNTLFQDKQKLKYLALMRLGSLEEFNKFLKGVSPKPFQINAIGESVSFEFDSKTFTIGAQDFLTFLFGPNKAEEFKSFLPSLYIPGIDSI
jgi:predicted N-acetyltransferase YhbS